MNLLKKLLGKKEEMIPIKQEPQVFMFEMNVGSGAYKAQGSSLEECKEAVIDTAQRINTKTPEYIN